LQPRHDSEPHVPGPSLWPVGFAVGIVVLLIGLVISWWIAGIGALLAAVFAFLWVRDLTAGTELAHAPEVPPESPTGPALPAPEGPAAMPPAAPEERYPRSKFLELSTLGIGGVIGGIVTVPALGFMIGPAFLKQGTKDHDIGPISDFPEGKYVVVTFTSDASQGTVSRRTAFVRNNGQVSVTLNGKQTSQPSFTIISNHCAHLGCPVQPNGPLDPQHEKTFGDVTLIPTISIAGFGCPCHGGQYDTEGNRTAGPPVRALDRYSFSIRNGRVFIGKPFSVSHVDGAGGTAKIHKWTFSFPGEHVNGIESWLYPVQPPH
jgi:quinol---cytochrome c reductase iron-sulfur subunit, bacillus type